MIFSRNLGPSESTSRLAVLESAVLKIRKKVFSSIKRFAANNPSTKNDGPMETPTNAPSQNPPTEFSCEVPADIKVPVPPGP